MLSDETSAVQSELASYCRGTHTNTVADVPSERAEVYRSLIQNVFEDTLGKAYPIAKAALSEDQWHQLLRDFIVNGRPSSPSLWQMPREFFEFAVEHGYPTRWESPWLYDLLYFEWLEIEVFMMPDQNRPAISQTGDFSSDKLVLNPDHRLVDLGYPVFKAPVSEIGPERGLYHLCIYRHSETLKVHFSELSALGAFWARLLAERPREIEELLGEAETKFGIPATKLRAQAQTFFSQLLLDNVIVGFLER